LPCAPSPVSLSSAVSAEHALLPPFPTRRSSDLVPNMPLEDVPVGGEEDSLEIKKVGEQKTGARDHLDIATERSWVDFERGAKVRSEEHTSELQSRENLVCRLLPEKKKHGDNRLR